MSEVPKSKRTKSPLEVIHRGFKIRRNIIIELKRGFGYTQNRFEKYIASKVEKMTHLTDEQKLIQAQRIRETEGQFNLWFVQREYERLANITQEMTSHLHAANTLYPTYYAEFIERRLEMDKAMVECNKLQDELQYILEVLPIDKNAISQIVRDVQEEFLMIKSLRQSDNRFLKELKDYDPKTHKIISTDKKVVEDTNNIELSLKQSSKKIEQPVVSAMSSTNQQLQELSQVDHVAIDVDQNQKYILQKIEPYNKSPVLMNYQASQEVMQSYDRDKVFKAIQEVIKPKFQSYNTTFGEKTFTTDDVLKDKIETSSKQTIENADAYEQNQPPDNNSSILSEQSQTVQNDGSLQSVKVSDEYDDVDDVDEYGEYDEFTAFRSGELDQIVYEDYQEFLFD